MPSSSTALLGRCLSAHRAAISSMLHSVSVSGTEHWWLYRFMKTAHLGLERLRRVEGGRRPTGGYRRGPGRIARRSPHQRLQSAAYATHSRQGDLRLGRSAHHRAAERTSLLSGAHRGRSRLARKAAVDQALCRHGRGSVYPDRGADCARLFPDPRYHHFRPRLPRKIGLPREPSIGKRARYRKTASLLAV